MRVAFGLARRRLGLTWPNPSVGAVIVRGAQLLGRGATAPGGRPHAETVAIEQAQKRFGAEALRGATAYVSLEPCAHHGQTPPCTDALIAAGIGRVVCSLADPDPRVAGQGIAALRAAGIEVTTGVMAAEARRLNAGFLSRVERGRPLITLKLATTLDGRIATRTGESRWITGQEARRRVHLMRANHDAILVGAGTARADDPMLDVRDLGLSDRQPVRIVTDGSLSLSPESRLARTASEQPLWLLHRLQADGARALKLAETGAELVPTASAPDGRLSLTEAMQSLGQRGITRIFCEGGGQLAGSLLEAGLVDQIALFTAGRAIGSDGIAAIGAFGIERLGDAPGFALDRVERIGADVLSWWSAG